MGCDRCCFFLLSLRCHHCVLHWFSLHSHCHLPYLGSLTADCAFPPSTSVLSCSSRCLNPCDTYLCHSITLLVTENKKVSYYHGKSQRFSCSVLKHFVGGKSSSFCSAHFSPAHHSSPLGPQEKKVKEKTLSLTLGCLLFSAAICIGKALPKG